jgi:hypothetical protein
MPRHPVEADASTEACSMKECGPASNDQMVLVFLRAEIESPAWGPRYKQAICVRRVDQTDLIDHANLADAHGNRVRGLILGDVRGYGRNEALFKAFPGEVEWRRVLLDPSDFGILRYVNSGIWPQLTRGSLSVIDGAQNAAADPALARRVDEISKQISKDAPIQDLILIDDLNGSLVILEGNTRATAFVRIKTKPIFALIGHSPRIRDWTAVWG